MVLCSPSSVEHPTIYSAKQCTFYQGLWHSRSDKDDVIDDRRPKNYGSGFLSLNVLYQKIGLLVCMHYAPCLCRWKRSAYSYTTETSCYITQRRDVVWYISVFNMQNKRRLTSDVAFLLECLQWGHHNHRQRNSDRILQGLRRDSWWPSVKALEWHQIMSRRAGERQCPQPFIFLASNMLLIQSSLIRSYIIYNIGIW